MIALFAYGGVWPMTMVNVMRDVTKASTAMGIISQREDAAKYGFEAAGAMKYIRPWKLALTIPHGDALIDRARSICARDFLKTDLDVLVMIDHDLEWNGSQGEYEGDICHIARLAAKTKGIVGGVVSKRTRGEGVATLFKEERMLDMGADELIEVHYVGSAFTAYHRSALEAVYESMGDMEPGFRPTFLPCVVDHPVNPSKRLHLSEDWAFCHRAQQLGIKTYATTRPIIKHWGHYPYMVTQDSEPADAREKRQEIDQGQEFPAVPRAPHPGPPPDRRGKLEGLEAGAPLTISMLHATRGRPEKAREAYDRWMKAASGEHNLEYILSVDVDDESMLTKAGKPRASGKWPATVKWVAGESRPGPVDAYNRALYVSTGDIIVQVHDDIEPPKNWDKLAVGKLAVDKPQLLHVDDGTDVNPEKPWLLTILCGTRAWFERAGFFYHPGYPSVFCDDDVSQMAIQAGAVIDAKHIKFKHAWGGAEGDETYKRAYQQKNWDAGRAHFEKRKKAGFSCEPERWSK